MAGYRWSNTDKAGRKDSSIKYASITTLLVLTIYCGYIPMAIHEATKYEELSQIWPLENTKRDKLQHHNWIF
jgi:hypothetical protein